MAARLLRPPLNIVVASALVAAACGGEVADSGDDGAAVPAAQAPATAAPTATEPDDTGETPTGDAPDDTGDAPEDEAATEPAEPEDPPPNIYEDPRGGIFAEFQATMDRGDHPFMQIDQFCVAHPPAADREATDKGIAADSISIVHIRSRLEQLVDIGFGVDVGDTAEMFETFAAVVNEQCGGIRGRMIDLHTVDVDVLTSMVDEENNAACIEAIEDHDAVVVVNSSSFRGSASLCIVEQHRTAFVSVQSQSAQFMERGEDRLITVSTVAEEHLSSMVLDLIAAGRLDGRTVGVAVEDTPGHYEAVEAGLVQTLIDGGADVAVFDVIGCGGSNVCLEGAVESVQRLRLEGVDVFFNLLNAISAPFYIAEMVAQGFEPGDVQFYASDFESQATELVASQIVRVGGTAAGDLYNGAVISDFRDTGAYRLEDFEPRAFDEMCNDTYGANSASGANHEAHERADGNERYGMTATVCELMRITLRGVYDAGDNPTRADIYASLASLGPIDSPGMYPASLRPGKTRGPDAIHNLVFEYPCTKPSPFPVSGHDDGICLYPIDEYRPAPR